MTVYHGAVSVEWLGYATIRVAGDDAVVYTDPGRYGCLTGEWSADGEAAGAAHPPARDYRAGDGHLVVVTHDHHYDPDGIRRVAREDATVAVYEAVHPPGIDRDVAPLGDLPQDVVRVDDETDALLADVVVRTVPAYNLPDGPNTDADGDPLHPEGFGCGYLLTLGATTVFWPGDTDVLDGHGALDVDVFCPPIGNFTMDRHDAAELAEALDPGLVVPVHYNTFAALDADSGAFAAAVAKRGVPVALDER